MTSMLYFFKIILLSSIIMEGSCKVKFKSLQAQHQFSNLSINQVLYLSGLTDQDYTKYVLDKILIPRVPGTENHSKVQQFISVELKNLGWTVKTMISEQNTPRGKIVFKNIIGTLGPAENHERYLVLACHYDSKSFPDIEFVGATDSAVPCAMLLNMAKVLSVQFQQMPKQAPLSLQLIFFDGEEAFETWGPTDSIYGAKALAKRYEITINESPLTGEVISDLDRIDVMMLLDLIGHKGTRFLSNFENTQSMFMRLAKIEDILSKEYLLDNYDRTIHRYFARKKFLGYIEDDHIPFMSRGVKILHLISTPFPKEWHTKDDNLNIIDFTVVENINKILRIFVAEYLDLNIEEAGASKTETEKLPDEL